MSRIHQAGRQGQGLQGQAKRPTLDDLPDGADPLLAQRLRQWRLERAQTDGVPAFVVFNDATLIELASKRPTDRRTLLRVKGFGPTKADRYGGDVLATIAGRA